MGSVASLVVAVALLAAAQMGLGAGAPRLPWMAPLLALWPPLASLMARRAARAGRMPAAGRWILATETSGAAAYAALVFGCGWLDAARAWTGDPLLPESWPGGALGLALAPFVVYQLLAIDASVRAHGGTRTTQRHLRAFQWRMFLAVLLPIAAFVAASALVAMFPWLRAQVEHVGLVWTLFMALFVALMALLFPRVIRWAWDTEAFPDGPQRELLDGVAARAGFQPRDLRVWRTGHLIANATIVGLSKRGRVVLFSDQLLSVLNSRELCAVYAHEIGHAARGHVAVFLAWTAGFFLLGDLATVAAMEAGGTAAAVATGLAFGVAWFFSFGWLSRRFELEADLFSFEVVRDLEALVSALERVGTGDRTRSGWRHFSVQRRVRFLGRAAADERFVRGFRGRLRAMAGVGFTLAAVSAVLQGAVLLEDLPRDRAVAALALGRYELAATRVGRLAPADAEELLPLVEAGRAAGESGREELEARLRGALTAADPAADGVRALARLGALRGVPRAGDVARALELAQEGDGEGAREVAEGVAGALGEALRSALAAR